MITPSKRTFLLCWIGGLVIFGLSIWLHSPLIIPEVPGGILDHQAAPDGASVDAIHAAWDRAGVLQDARVAMFSDLVFIGVYGLGCVLGGQYYRAASGRALKTLGWIALLSGVVFLVTDYGETVAQLIQLIAMKGDDDLAGFASSMGGAKVVSFSGGFLAVIAALIMEWRS